MASMRICVACNRPNGPNFSRCMSCGSWIGYAAPTVGGPVDSDDGARRAVRLLESMTPERRALLPAEFLRSLQKQARGQNDAAGESGAYEAVPAFSGSHPPISVSGPADESLEVSTETQRSVPSTVPAARRPEPVRVQRVVPPSPGRQRLNETVSGTQRSAMTTSGIHQSPWTTAGPPRPVMGDTGRHRALAIPEAEVEVETSSLEVSLDLPLDLGVEDDAPVVSAPGLGFEGDPDQLGLEPGPLEVELGAVGDAAREDDLDPLWEDSASVRAIAVVGADGDHAQMISVLDDFPDLLDDAQWGGSLTASEDAPSVEPDWSNDPMVLSLSAGRGPFGDRDARFRLLLLPNAAYAPNEQKLKLALHQVMGIDLYSARLTLKKPIPVPLASGDDPREINNQARDLRLAGLDVLMVERGFWLDGILPLPVRSMAGRAPGPVTFKIAGGGTETTPRERFGYCVLGALDTPGGRTLWVLDLFLADAPICLRIRSDQFDFSLLGVLAKGPPARRMQLLVQWLSMDPHVPLPVDEAFRHVPATFRSVSSASPDIASGVADFTEYSLLCDQGRRVT
ncbi:MAG: hypothetical protein KDA24_20905 [Deltaproteobacteria bacterium]|nr:hypothetical protein [Deltaproteobacteria bacterium]